MGIFAVLKHVAGNVVSIHQLIAEVKMMVMSRDGIDISAAPEPLRSKIHEFIKERYLSGYGSAVVIAESLDMMVLVGYAKEADHLNKTQTLAHQGVPEAQNTLGNMYYSGAGGLPYDHTLAAHWFRKSADQGFADAQGNLGYMYRTGDDGVPQDYERAVMWFRKAANQGDTGRQVFLAEMCHSGDGAPQDDVQAMMWYRISEASGDTSGEQGLQEIESKASAAQIAESQRLAHDWLSTHQ
ncbi:MAG: tetratricopeptide repeat protein [Rhodoferax sp.]|nr:tetratricopeptide repeat protein [Rhodoferax sp.]